MDLLTDLSDHLKALNKALDGTGGDLGALRRVLGEFRERLEGTPAGLAVQTAAKVIDNEAIEAADDNADSGVDATGKDELEAKLDEVLRRLKRMDNDISDIDDRVGWLRRAVAHIEDYLEANAD